jgi:hypothetical protein
MEKEQLGRLVEEQEKAEKLRILNANDPNAPRKILARIGVLKNRR